MRILLKATLLLAGLSALASAAPIDVWVGARTGAFGFEAGNGGGFQAQLNATSGPANTTFYCVDIDNYISPPTTYKANLTSLSSGDFSQTKLGYGGVIQNSLAALGLSSFGFTDSPELRYKLAAILVVQYNTVVASQRAFIQNAIWKLTDQTGENSSAALDAKNWLTTAATLLAGNPNVLKWNEIFIVSDPVPIDVQEMLVFTPEPTAVALLVTAMLALFFLVRRHNTVPDVQ